MRWFPPIIRVALLAGCWLGSPSGTFGSVSVYLGPEALAESSAIVAEARVVDSRSGVDPESGRLATYVTLDLLQVHRGPKSLGRITLREPGGEFGEVALVVDSAPQYSIDEEVLVFASVASDGALRTAGHFFGKFTRLEGEATWARDLSGAVADPSRASSDEHFTTGELLAVTVQIARERGSEQVEWLAEPPELDRLEWAPEGHDGIRFAPFSWTHPARWVGANVDSPIRFRVDPTGQPFASDAQTMNALLSAAESWRYVPEASVAVSVDPSPMDFAATRTQSPQEFFYPNTNIVLFGDPYDELPSPVNCSGILAVGGYWRGTQTVGEVNGREYYPILQAYVIFNEGIECFLQSESDLAEIAAHELGHALGFGHSGQQDSIMRGSPYGARGARLGNDDRDAAHCLYPYPLVLTSPTAGKHWVAGSKVAVTWESERDPETMATVEIQLSYDDGVTWSALAQNVVDDGEWIWQVPTVPADRLQLRVVRPHNNDETWSQQPNYCSGDQTAGAFRTIRAQKHHRLFEGRRDDLGFGFSDQ